ncbi:MAG: two-component system, OmpR family, sensor kinase [Actinomycetota bacterium]|jgi:two-component system OmpR family sensor kinase|nr:two-component system, OmpR family, sensor kinase [Actinomycetota bacterium]
MWRLRSLRARLVAGLLTVAAVGVLVLGFGTYRALEGFLQDRTHEQLRDSQDPVYNELARAAFPGHRRPSGQSVILTGTYAELRRPGDGPLVTYYTEGWPVPKLDTAPVAKERYYTAPADPGGGSYRVLVTPLDDGSVFSVALPLDDNRATLRHLLGIEVGMGLGVLVALAALGWWVVRLGLRPLDHIGATAEAIAAGDLSRRVERAEERTEVGRLGLALNRMLGQIESAFDERRATEDRLRRFVADASHELRTPLTSIRGYAELFRRGASDRPEDLALAMRRIEEESARMGVLVEDLLLLARLDQARLDDADHDGADGPRPFERAPVDLARLAADAVADARAVSPDRTITFSDGAPVTVLGDELRLRQVAANLLSNALVHTPPGTAVRVKVSAVGDQARLEVSDDGPGLAPEAAERVFERFFRVDKARSRATGGAGLGLSIVAAIAEVHGGTARLEPPAPDRAGATFVVELPLAVEILPSSAELTGPKIG